MITAPATLTCSLRLSLPLQLLHRPSQKATQKDAVIINIPML